MNAIIITTAGRPDIEVVGNDLLLSVIAHAKSLTDMVEGDFHVFTASTLTHAIDATISAEGAAKHHRVDMVFRELVYPGIQDQPGGKFVRAANQS